MAPSVRPGLTQAAGRARRGGEAGPACALLGCCCVSAQAAGECPCPHPLAPDPQSHCSHRPRWHPHWLMATKPRWRAGACAGRVAAGGAAGRVAAALARHYYPAAAAAASVAAAARAARDAAAAAPAGPCVWWAALMRAAWRRHHGCLASRCANVRWAPQNERPCRACAASRRCPQVPPPPARRRCCQQTGCSPPLHLQAGQDCIEGREQQQGMAGMLSGAKMWPACRRRK